ncbi:MAG: hypothetical protein ABWK04_05440 [Hydrogenobacter sp.]|uniref:hypothetical protein n=1 Tax=Hydrogenobacter thermophilus TaxID=940 RepID=UPI0030F93A4C
MSYYRELKDSILSLKEVFFLSPREIWFLKFLEDAEYPLEVVKEGIEEFYLSISPEKRSKTPLFFSFEYVKRAYERYALKRGRQVKMNWLKIYKEKLESVKHLLKDANLPKIEPKDEAQAENILISIENVLVKRLWEAMPKEKKNKILRKYSQFRENEELFKLMIKHEIMKNYGIKPLSLYVS